MALNNEMSLRSLYSEIHDVLLQSTLDLVYILFLHDQQQEEQMIKKHQLLQGSKHALKFVTRWLLHSKLFEICSLKLKPTVCLTNFDLFSQTLETTLIKKQTCHNI